MFRFLIVLGCVVLLCFACWFAWDMYTKATLRRAIHRDLGFTLAYVEDDLVPRRRVKRVDAVVPDGVFATAGFLDGDVIVDDLWLGQFYRWLHRSRGSAVTIQVVRAGAGPPPGESKELALTFTVPHAAGG